jgi:hypothetical protein
VVLVSCVRAPRLPEASITVVSSDRRGVAALTERPGYRLCPGYCPRRVAVAWSPAGRESP